MRRGVLLVVAATVASLVGLRASAQDNGNKQDQRPAAADARAKLTETLFKRLDADKDGKLSLEEFQKILTLAKSGAKKGGEPLSNEAGAKPEGQADGTQALDDAQAAKLLAKMIGGAKGGKGGKEIDLDKLADRYLKKGPKGEGGRKGGKKNR